MKIKYVGLKECGESAFKAETGKVWFKGDEHEIPDGIAKRMLNHPDVFELVETPDQPPIGLANAKTLKMPKAPKAESE